MQPAVLASRMGTSVAMIEAMLSQLQRMGMLSEVNLNCNEPCGGCPLVNGCLSRGDQGRLWQITRKVH